MTESAPVSAPRWRLIVLEAVVAFGVAGIFTAASLLIRVKATDRVGQVSGLSYLALRYVLVAIALIAVLVVAQRARGGRGFELAWRLTCAATAGLFTGMIAGGILVALRGTPWGLRGGDTGALAAWASALQRGATVPAAYPPLSLHVLARYSDWLGIIPEHALKHLQVIGTAAFGPVAYLSWRMLLRPGWALSAGVIALIPFIEPYKPYPNLVLVVFVPLSILFLSRLREVESRSTRQVVQASVGFGVAYGVLCLGYSGWFQWSIPGLFVATLLLFPWRAAPGKGALLLGLTAVVFLVVTWSYVSGMLLDPAAKIVDKYMYFDTRTEPMYVAMFRNDLPGTVGVWPPLGELGGVGLFTIVLLIGLGVAVALGRRTTLVIGATSMMGGAWIFRFFYARMMWETKLVQLYPRTTALILYLLLLLSVYGVALVVERLALRDSLRGPSARIGVACAMLLLLASVGSATADRYMPSAASPPGPGLLSWNAQGAGRNERAEREKRPRAPEALPRPWVRRSL